MGARWPDGPMDLGYGPMDSILLSLVSNFWPLQPSPGWGFLDPHLDVLPVMVEMRPLADSWNSFDEFALIFSQRLNTSSHPA